MRVPRTIEEVRAELIRLGVVLAALVDDHLQAGQRGRQQHHGGQDSRDRSPRGRQGDLSRPRLENRSSGEIQAELELVVEERRRVQRGIRQLEEELGIVCRAVRGQHTRGTIAENPEHRRNVPEPLSRPGAREREALAALGDGDLIREEIRLLGEYQNHLQSLTVYESAYTAIGRTQVANLAIDKTNLALRRFQSKVRRPRPGNQEDWRQRVQSLRLAYVRQTLVADELTNDIKEYWKKVELEQAVVNALNARAAVQSMEEEITRLQPQLYTYEGHTVAVIDCQIRILKLRRDLVELRETIGHQKIKLWKAQSEAHESRLAVQVAERERLRARLESRPSTCNPDDSGSDLEDPPVVINLVVSAAINPEIPAAEPAADEEEDIDEPIHAESSVDDVLDVDEGQ
jgi:hypothetical protein